VGTEAPTCSATVQTTTKAMRMERVKELHSRWSARFSAALVIMLLLMVAGEMMAR